jgi:hypothetical protein
VEWVRHFGVLRKQERKAKNVRCSLLLLVTSMEGKK